MPSSSPSSASSSLTVTHGQATLTTTSAVKELTRLLHEYGDKILDGKAMLSLTTESLAVLNNGFDAIRENREDKSFDVLPPNYSPLTVLPELQFIHDFVQKTPSLRLVHGNNTIQGSVSLQTFRSLRHLEMRRIPVHLLQGLQRVRPRLVVLSVERCLHQLQDLFEAVPPEDSAVASLSWGALEKVYLPYNFVEHLDGSLRLLPLVKVLDISHNCLKSTDAYLGYLTELVHLNLSYNSLPAIPSLSMSSRTRLVTLVLANNHIDSLTGLESLEALEILDLSNNLLCDHGGLTPLRRLGSLKELYLAFNPLAYHKQHRSRTMPHVAPIVVRTLRLDGAPFSTTEQAHGRTILVARRPPSAAAATGRRSILTGSRANLLSNMDGDDLIVDDNTLDSLTVSLQSRTSVRRVRSIQINDIDDVDESCGSGGGAVGGAATVVRSGEPATAAALSLRATAVQNEIASARQEMEQRRRQLGDSWLTSLVTSTPISTSGQQSVPAQSAVSASAAAAAAPASLRTTEYRPATNGLQPPPLVQQLPPEVASGSLRAQSVASGLLRQQQQKYQQQPLQPSAAASDSLYSAPVSSSPAAEILLLPQVLPGVLTVAAHSAAQASVGGMPLGFATRADQAIPVAVASLSTAPPLAHATPPTAPIAGRRSTESAGMFSAGTAGKAVQAVGVAGLVPSSDASAAAVFSTALVAPAVVGTATTAAAHAVAQPALSQVNDEPSKRSTASAVESALYLPGSINIVGDDADDDDVDLVWKDVIEDEELDSADEELFIVYPLHLYPAGGSTSASSAEPCIVSICGHYLTEKDHNGRIREKLDMRMLSLASIASPEDPKDHAVVNLQFNYVRKDRRERHYSMETVQSAEQFLALLSPMLKLRQQSAAAAGGNIMQCLRCNQTFAKEAADVRVHHKEEEQTKKDAAVSEVLHCPSCGSPHVVKHEGDQSASERPTPLPLVLPRTGSVGSLLTAVAAGAGSPVQFEPLATSSRMTTPEGPAHFISGSRVLHHKKRLAASAGGTPLYGSLCNVSESTSFYSLMEDDAAAQMVSASGSYRSVDMFSAASTRHSSDRWPGAVASAEAAVARGKGLSSSSSERGSRETLVSEDPGLTSPAATAGDSRAVHRALLEVAVSKMESAVANAGIAANHSSMASTDEATRPRSLSGLASLGSDDSGGCDVTMLTTYHTDSTAMVTAADGSMLGARLAPGIQRAAAAAVPGTFDLTILEQAAADAVDESVPEKAMVSGSVSQIACADDAVVVEESSQLTFHFDDFTIVDHRLKLFLAMEHFADDETCEGVLLSTAVQHNTAMHFVGVVALSSAAIYIFKIARHQSKRVPPGAGGASAIEPDLAATVTLVEHQPLVDLCYVDSALNHQNFRLEFERSGYCFLVRDEQRCKSFVALLTGIVRRVAFDPSCRLQAITKIHSEYLECFGKWIQDDEDADIGSSNGSVGSVGDAGRSSEADEPCYFMALLRGSVDSASKTTSAVGFHEADSALDGLEPVSVFLTGGGLYVLKENCYLPLSRCSSESAKKSYFNVRFRLKISDVSQVNVFDDSPRGVEVETFNESSAVPELPLQCKWRFVMATRASALAFIGALSSRWEALFGVELQVDSLGSGDGGGVQR